MDASSISYEWVLYWNGLFILAQQIHLRIMLSELASYLVVREWKLSSPSGMKQGRLPLPLPLNSALEALTRTVRQKKKKIKDTQIVMEEVALSWFADDKVL